MSYVDSIVLFRPKPATHYSLWATIIIILAHKLWSGDSSGMDVAPSRKEVTFRREVGDRFPDKVNSRIDRNSGKSVVLLGHVLPSKKITFGTVKQKACSSKKNIASLVITVINKTTLQFFY